MFHPLPVFVGLRYVRTRRQGFFVSFISWISMAGVCLGVAALITIISVMNGFEGELRNRLVSLTAHATVSGPPERLANWQAVTDSIRTVPGVEGVAPFVDVQAMLGRTGMNVSDISFGAWAIGGSWGQVDDAESMAALHAAVDNHMVTGPSLTRLTAICAWKTPSATGAPSAASTWQK